ncbi:hypothetical protein PFISCL1PPCAC_1226, partial [Pristionchus fissidentatus]
IMSFKQILSLRKTILATKTSMLIVQISSDIVLDIMAFTSDLFSFGPAWFTMFIPGPIQRFVVKKITVRLRITDSNSGNDMSTQ